MERYGDPKTIPPMDGVALENFYPRNPPKRKSCQDALRTTFSDKNRMRRSAPVRVRGGGYHAKRYPYRDHQFETFLLGCKILFSGSDFFNA